MAIKKTPKNFYFKLWDFCQNDFNYPRKILSKLSVLYSTIQKTSLYSKGSCLHLRTNDMSILTYPKIH